MKGTSKAFRRLLVRLFGPEYVCNLFGHDFTKQRRGSWFLDAECRRCNANINPDYDPWDE